MPGLLERLRRLLPGLWAGVLVCIATMATAAPFAVLARPDAGRVVGRIFVQEAWLSLALAVLLLGLERQRAQRAAAAGLGSVLSTEMLLVLGTVFCTVVGYFGVQPLLADAKAGQAASAVGLALSFGQLHAISFGLFGLKILLVVVLAWRAAGAAAGPVSPAPSS